MNDSPDLLPHLHSANPKRSLRYSRILLILALAALALGGGIRLQFNLREANALETYTEDSLRRVVLVTHAVPGELLRNVTLPTTLRGNTEALIYARSAGYLSAWHKGIGDWVAKGELMASIDAPEQEQELAQARAQHEQMEVRLDLARQTLVRWEELQVRNAAVALQDLEEKRSALRQAEADLAAAAANVQRLEQLENYRSIVAPFAGIITRRSVEVGDLVDSGKELFALAQPDPLRLTIWVPQVYAEEVNIGTEVALRLNEQAGANITATIDRVAGAIDPRTRSRQVDLILPNSDASLLPGAYAEVSLVLSRGREVLVVPSGVLVITEQGPRVAIVGQEGRVQFRQVTLGRDLGLSIEVLDGITAEDLLIVNPPDQLVENEEVSTQAWPG